MSSNNQPTENKDATTISGAAMNLASSVANYAYQTAQSAGNAIGLTASRAATSAQETGESLQAKVQELFQSTVGQTQSAIDEVSAKVSKYVEYTQTLGHETSQRAVEGAVEAEASAKNSVNNSFNELQKRALEVKKSIIDYTNATVQTIEGKTQQMKDPNAQTSSDPIASIKSKAATLTKGIYDYTNSTLDHLETKYPDQAARTRHAINSLFENIFPPKTAEEIKQDAQQTHLNSETYDKLNQAIIESNIAAGSDQSVHDRVEAIQNELAQKK